MEDNTRYEEAPEYESNSKSKEGDDLYSKISTQRIVSSHYRNVNQNRMLPANKAGSPYRGEDISKKRKPIHNHTSARHGNIIIGVPNNNVNTTTSVPCITSHRNTKKQKQMVQHNYHDRSQETVEAHVQAPNPTTNTVAGTTHTATPKKAKKKKKKKVTVTETFPAKLHRMLDQVKLEGLAHIVSWQPHGRAFLVHNTNDFVNQIMPRFFSQRKYTSFTRQLNLYSFSRITVGKDKGSYYHEYFLRGYSHLVRNMHLVKVRGTRTRRATNPAAEPDFYRMPFIGQAVEGTHGSQLKEEEDSYCTKNHQGVDSINTEGSCFDRQSIEDKASTSSAVLPHVKASLLSCRAMECNDLASKGCTSDEVNQLPYVSSSSFYPLHDGASDTNVNHTQESSLKGDLSDLQGAGPYHMVTGFMHQSEMFHETNCEGTDVQMPQSLVSVMNSCIDIKCCNEQTSMQDDSSLSIEEEDDDDRSVSDDSLLENLDANFLSSNVEMLADWVKKGHVLTEIFED